jgi:hypothetical protein
MYDVYLCLLTQSLAFGCWDDILLKNNSKASSMQERGGEEGVWGCNIHVLWKLSVGTMPSYPLGVNAWVPQITHVVDIMHILWKMGVVIMPSNNRRAKHVPQLYCRYAPTYLSIGSMIIMLSILNPLHQLALHITLTLKTFAVFF